MNSLNSQIKYGKTENTHAHTHTHPHTQFLRRNSTCTKTFGVMLLQSGRQKVEDEAVG